MLWSKRFFVFRAVISVMDGSCTIAEKAELMLARKHALTFTYLAYILTHMYTFESESPIGGGEWWLRFRARALLNTTPPTLFKSVPLCLPAVIAIRVVMRMLLSCAKARARAMCRVGQSCTCTPYMTACMVFTLLKLPFIHRIYTHMCVYMANLSHAVEHLFALRPMLTLFPFCVLYCNTAETHTRAMWPSICLHRGLCSPCFPSACCIAIQRKHVHAPCGQASVYMANLSHLVEHLYTLRPMLTLFPFCVLYCNTAETCTRAMWPSICLYGQP